jgi:hypothetical protein
MRARCRRSPSSSGARYNSVHGRSVVATLGVDATGPRGRPGVGFLRRVRRLEPARAVPGLVLGFPVPMRSGAFWLVRELSREAQGGVPMFLSSIGTGFSAKWWRIVFGQEPTAGGVCAPADASGLSGCRGARRVVERAVAEHREEDVAAAPGEGDEGLVVPFALGALPVVVRP